MKGPGTSGQGLFFRQGAGKRGKQEIQSQSLSKFFSKLKTRRFGLGAAAFALACCVLAGAGPGPLGQGQGPRPGPGPGSGPGQGQGRARARARARAQGQHQGQGQGPDLILGRPDGFLAGSTAQPARSCLRDWAPSPAEKLLAPELPRLPADGPGLTQFRV